MQELITQLTSSLGISDEQAEGGAGAIFAMAKEKLGDADFSSLTDAVGDVDGLIEKAPDAGDEVEDAGAGGLLGGLGGLTSKLGGAGGMLGNLGGVAALTGTFSKLGISPDKLGGFVEVITNFVKEKGGGTVSALLGKFMK